MSDLRASAHDLASVERVEFGQFVRPHWVAMAALARRMCGADGEDVLQDALALAWRTRKRFDPDRGSPRTWLLTLVADQARKQLGRLARRLPAVLVLTDVDVPDRTDIAEAAIGIGIDIERTLTTLTPRQRLAAELFYFLDLPVDEIAEVMACSEGTVKSTLSDARARLRAALGSDYR